MTITDYTPEEFEVEVHALMRYAGFTREEAAKEIMDQG
jgi:hypothetical protein